VPVEQALRGMKAAKLIRTWKAILVFSESTISGPSVSAKASIRS
jgi:hypothetical protein